MKQESIGEQLSPILEEIADTLWEFEAAKGYKPNYSIDGFEAATKIFMSVLMDKIHELQSSEDIPLDDRIKMVTKAGQDVRALIKTYTNLDTFEFYKK